VYNPIQLQHFQGKQSVVTKKNQQTKSSSELPKPVDTEKTLPVRFKALVFVSHDSRDSDIAEAFANLLSDVSAGTLKSFRSSDKKGNTGIEFGAEWYTSIMSQLGEATDVVALLTARSIDRPWILYEAGVAKGKLETTVLGLALGVPLDKVSTGPFGQFQNCGDDEDSLTQLVLQLLRRNPDAAPREEAVRMQVKRFIELLANMPTQKPKKHAQDGAAHEDQNVAKLFEEVKAMVRELPERLDNQERNSARRLAGRGPRRFHPKMVESMMHRLSSQSTDEKAAGLLVLLSLIKDDAVWLYELGLQIYRAIVAEDRRALIAAHKQIQATMEFISHGPWAHEMFRPDEERSYMLVEYFPKFFERLVMEHLETMPSIRRSTKIEKLINSNE
jgi:hypothetical protein